MLTLALKIFFILCTTPSGAAPKANLTTDFLDVIERQGKKIAAENKAELKLKHLQEIHNSLQKIRSQSTYEKNPAAGSADFIFFSFEEHFKKIATQKELKNFCDSHEEKAYPPILQSEFESLAQALCK